MSTRLGVGLIAVAVALLITATAGGSVVSMERPLTVSVVDDEDAGVAVEPVDPEVSDNAGSETATERADENATDAPPLGERDLLRVANRLGERIEITDLEFPDGISDASGWIGTEIEPGETATLEGTVDCGEFESDGSEPTATVELSSGDVTVAQTVGLEVACPPNRPDGKPER
ncbi:hypothetical protein [Natronococcus jeotgali]|uniref:Uncharacterized protein n=1 Tax=Natronococcus jeotgali DSM 18795 TaxID=1227498 RepID=L9WPS5_9EURY|nr:hypothetical protein [Natronococcus jeotgali]ELY51211.1 hypothetical protein C492_21100 [Natronococcus jeotgali DSM 18795]